MPDLLLFYGVPTLLGALGWYYGWKFNADVLNALLAAFSIFAGLLLNLLILVYTFSSQTEHPTAMAKNRTMVKELHDNIAYSILVSIVLVVVTMITVAHLKMHERPPEVAFTGPWVTGTVIFLTLNFILTLLMSNLKRIYIMLDQTIGKPFISKKSA